MKHTLAPFAMLLCFVLVLAACAPKVQTEAPMPPPEATAAPATTAPEATAAGEPTVAAEPAPAAAEHTALPGDLPAGVGLLAGDQSSISSLNKGRALVGDRFTLGKFERPYNADAMDVYFPFLDIVSASFYPEQTWVYVRITLVGPDANGAFPAKYGVEIDSDMDGHGDMLLLLAGPTSQEWTTDGVEILQDQNADVGGENIINSDSEGKGDGYEFVVFDQGQGPDPDAAWARLSPADPNSIEVAFKASLLEGDSTYLAGIWAGTDILNPALFDINDHFSHEEAGEANPEFANFYPIKGVAELDNTCRAAIGFVQSGNEPAVCPQG